MNRLTWIAATGGGLGLSPFAPGTVGTIPGVVLVLFLGAAGVGWMLHAAIAVALTLAAIPVCGAAEEAFGVKDDRRIVADEYATFPLCTIGIPWAEAPWLLALAFVTNRVMDIVKPPPARGLQVLRGGAGIVMDDVFSSMYALAINHVVWWAWQRFAAT
jgi:phosphatidylglycerophosphatase A